MLVSVIFIYPLFFLLANSLRPYISKTPVLFFTESHFENYYFAVAMIPFTKYLLNTMKMVVITITGTLIFDFLFGYAFARLRAPGKNLIFKPGAAPTDDPRALPFRFPSSCSITRSV